MNCYEKLINYLAENRVGIVYERAKKNAFPNLMLNKFDEIVSKVKFKKTGIEPIPQETINTMRNKAVEIKTDNINYVKDNPDAPFKLTKNKRIIYVIDDTVWFGTDHNYIDAFEDEEKSFLLAFIISQKFNIKINKDDLKPPKGDVDDLINRAILNNSLNYMRKRSFDNSIIRKQNDINHMYESIQQFKAQIKNLEKEIKDMEETKLFGLVSNQKEETIEYLLRHNLINKRSILYRPNRDGVELEFITNDIFAYKLNTAYLQRAKDRIFPQFEEFRKHLDDIIEGKTKIYIGRYKFAISLSKTGRMNINYAAMESKYQNPHARMNCMGTARTDYLEALENYQLVNALNIVFEHLQAINFGDTASSSTPTLCKLYKEGELVYDAHNKES